VRKKEGGDKQKERKKEKILKCVLLSRAYRRF
jgi:hypothetical protein